MGKSNVKFPATINIRTDIQVSKCDIAAMISTVLCQEYGIPVGDFDMVTHKINGKYLICAEHAEEYEETVKSDDGTTVSIISHNEDAALLFDAMVTLESE